MSKTTRPSFVNVLVLVCCGAIGVSAFLFVGMREPRARLGADLCEVGAVPTASVLVLADPSDPLTTIDARRLERTIEFANEKTAVGGKLIMTALQANGMPTEFFGRCRPVATGDPLTENVDKLVKRYEREFVAPQGEIAKQLAQEPALKSSPLIEAITAVSRRPDFDGTIRNRTLLILSDMLQFSPGGLSHYKPSRDLMKAFKASPLGTMDLPDLKGVTVIVDYLPRQHPAQGPAHRAFWSEFFRLAGAASVTFLGVPAGEQS